jgi:hypothetical protein
MKADLLLRGADLLEANANNPEGMKFDLEDWLSNSHGGKGLTLDHSTLKANCGSVGCAMGLFAASGAFEKEGLTTGSAGPFRWHGGHNTAGGYHLAVMLFAISPSEAEYLFSPTHYEPAVDDEGRYTYKGKEMELRVAARIRDFVKEPLTAS